MLLAVGRDHTGLVDLAPAPPEEGVVRISIDVGQFFRRYIADRLSHETVLGEADVLLVGLVAAEEEAPGILVEDGSRDGVENDLQEVELAP